MRPRTAAVLCALALAVLATGASPVAGAQDRPVEACAATPPADFADPEANTSEVIGWVDGYWYNEPIDVDPEANLTEAELDAVAARSAARVEALRCLAFQERPPIRVRPREAVRANQTATAENASLARRQFANATYETLLMVEDGTDALEVRRQTLGTASRGYYDPATGEVVLIVADPAAPGVDEVTLAHEYVHALQDQHFGLGQYNASLTDRRAGQEGLIEGDAAFVEHRYERRCGDVWSCTAGAPVEDDEGGNVGIELLLFQQYNDGAAFVRHVYERHGWEGVDARYRTPPWTAHHTIYPESYPEFDPEPVAVVNHTNATNGTWERVRPPDHPGYDRLGPASIAAATMAPTFENPRTENRLYSELQLYNINGTERDPLVPFDYDVDAVRGWEGDRFEVYANESNETTAVWRIRWNDSDDATRFRDRYAQLLVLHGATPSEDTEGTFRFDDADGHSGVVFLGIEDDEVVVVSAPERNAIVEHYRPELEYVPNGTWDPTTIPDTTPAQRGAGRSDELAGPGVVAAVAALVVAVAAIVTRRRG